MVTRPQIDKLSARIEALIADSDRNARPVCLWRSSDETEEQALARHYQQRPEDRAAKQTYIFQWVGAS